MFFKAMLAFLTNSTFCLQNCGRKNCVTILMHELSTSSASPSRKKEDEEEMTLSWGQKVFSKQEFRSIQSQISQLWDISELLDTSIFRYLSQPREHVNSNPISREHVVTNDPISREYANAKEEDFEAPMKKKLVCDAKKLLADGHVPKNK